MPTHDVDDFSLVVGRPPRIYNRGLPIKRNRNMSPHNSEVSPASKVCRNQNNLAAEIDDELVLMSVEQGNYFGLDAIGADIWRRLENQTQVSDLCDALSKEYDGDIDTIRRDVLALLQRLAAEGLIDVEN